MEVALTGRAAWSSLARLLKATIDSPVATGDVPSFVRNEGFGIEIRGDWTPGGKLQEEGLYKNTAPWTISRGPVGKRVLDCLHLLGRWQRDRYGFILRTPSLTK